MWYWKFKICRFYVVKRIYSEKATKFWGISTLLLPYVVPVKSKVEILQNFVAFSEYVNFNSKVISYKCQQGVRRWSLMAKSCQRSLWTRPNIKCTLTSPPPCGLFLRKSHSVRFQGYFLFVVLKKFTHNFSLIFISANLPL